MSRIRIQGHCEFYSKLWHATDVEAVNKAIPNAMVMQSIEKNNMLKVVYGIESQKVIKDFRFP